MIGWLGDHAWISGTCGAHRRYCSNFKSSELLTLCPPSKCYRQSMGHKGGRCVGLTTLNFYVPTVLKSGNLNILEPSGPVQACPDM